MSLETEIQGILSAICSRSFPDFAPIGTATPYITWQQISGAAPCNLDNAVPSKRNGRIQINYWDKTRVLAAAGALAIESAMIAASHRPTGAFTATFDEDLSLRGTIQDFTVWSDR